MGQMNPRTKTSMALETACVAALHMAPDVLLTPAIRSDHLGVVRLCMHPVSEGLWLAVSPVSATLVSLVVVSPTGFEAIHRRGGVDYQSATAWFLDFCAALADDEYVGRFELDEGTRLGCRFSLSYRRLSGSRREFHKKALKEVM